MPKAVWNGKVIAETETYEYIEGNVYFPPKSIKSEYFKKSSRNTVCPWKGTASYFDVEVDGKVNKAAAWYYPSPSNAAKKIKDHVAFWHGVKVES